MLPPLVRPLRGLPVPNDDRKLQLGMYVGYESWEVTGAIIYNNDIAAWKYLDLRNTHRLFFFFFSFSS